MKKLLLLLPLLLSLACGSAPRPSKEAFSKIQVGMTEAQVSELVGKPSSIFVLPDDQALVNWTYSEKDWVNFNAGKVLAVVYDEKDLAAPLASPAAPSAPSAQAPTAPDPGQPASQAKAAARAAAKSLAAPTPDLTSNPR